MIRPGVFRAFESGLLDTRLLMVSEHRKPTREQLRAFSREVGQLEGLFEEIREGLAGVNRSYQKALVITHSLRGASRLLRLKTLRMLSESAEASIRELIHGNASTRNRKLRRLLELSQAILEVCENLNSSGTEGEGNYAGLLAEARKDDSEG